MAEDAPVTFNDLPDDMLHEIFERVFDEGEGKKVMDATDPPTGTHLALRSVCRRLRPVADCDAALGRLRPLKLFQWAAMPEAMTTEDPFFLRAALDAGTWQPHRLTGLEELIIVMEDGDRLRPSFRPTRRRSRVGAEWAPLAAQVTQLEVRIESPLHQEPSTGIVAGLGALMALRSLFISGFDPDVPGHCTAHSHAASPLAIDRLRAPHLTELQASWILTPLNLAAFPSLVYVNSISCAPRQAPLHLRTLVARSIMQKLVLSNNVTLPPVVNLAELFVGGGGLPVLRVLCLYNMVFEWDTTGLDGTPTRPSLRRALGSCCRHSSK